MIKPDLDLGDDKSYPTGVAVTKGLYIKRPADSIPRTGVLVAGLQAEAQVGGLFDISSRTTLGSTPAGSC